MADNIIAPPQLPGQGQDSGLQQHMAEFNQTIGLTSPQDLASVNTNVYDPRPSAIDIYNKVVGNPIIGSNPGARLPANDISQSLNQLNTYNDAVSQRVLQTASANPDKTELMRTFTYNGDYDGANFDRYYNSAPFKELGYNPYRNNDALYNNHMTTGDEFVRAAGQWPSLVKTGLNPFLSGEEASKRMTRAMAVGSSTKEGVTPFLINTGLNMGYTIGIGAQMAAESLALWGATAITGGLDSEITLPAWAAAMGEDARKLQQAGETVETLSQASKASKLSQLKTFWNSSQYGKALGVIGQSINPLENTWELGKDIASGANALKFAGEAPGTIKRFAQFSNNFAEFGKDMISIQAAVSEAKLEGGGVKLDVVHDLSQKFREKNGYDPTGEELGKIENIANDEAYRTAFWNMPAIMWSNKFMYNTMFKPFEESAKTGLMKLGEDIFFNKKNAFTAVSEGIKGELEKLGKNLATPSKWKEFGYEYLKENAAEGVQENLQEAISSGAKSHAMALYNNPDRASYEGYMGHFMNGMKQQFSGKGAETFAGGFVMGAMAHPFMAGPHWAAQQFWNNTFNSKKYADYKSTKKAQLDATVNTLNEIYKDPAKYLAPDIVNAIKQGNLSHELILANLDNNRKKHEDVKFVSSYDHIFTAIRTGKFDVILDKFKEFKNFTPEEAAQAFTPHDSKVPLTAEQGTKAMTMLDDIVKRAHLIKENYDEVSANFPNPHDPFRYPADSNERTAQTHAYAAWEEGKRNLIFAKTAFQDHEQRIAKLADTLIKKRNPIKGANAQDIITLMDKEQLAYVTTALQQDIKVADRTTPEGRKIAKEKEEKLALLVQYAFHTDVLDKNRNLSKIEAKTKQQLFDEGKEGGFNLKYHTKELKKVFKQYINHIAGSKGNLIFDDEVNHAFNLIRDNYTLRDERASFVKSINILNTPKGFLNLYRGLAQTFKEIDDTKSAFIKERIDSLFPTNTQFNNAANTLAAKAAVLLTPEYATKLLSELKNKQKLSLPTKFIDAINPDENNPVEIGHPKFKNALDVWAGCLLMIEDDIAKEAAKTATPVTTATPAGTPITKNMLLSNPAYDGIRDEISAVLDKMIKTLGITDPAEIALQQENLLKTNPEIASIIAEHNKKSIIPSGEVISEPSTITLTAAQQATIASLKPVIEKIKQATTDAGYVIDGEAFNNRVSNIVKEILQKQLSAADFKVFTEYSENENSVGPEIMDKATNLFESDAVKNETDIDKKIDMVFLELEKDTIGLVFKNEFTKKTLNTFKEALKTDFTIENFKKQLNKLKNIRATTRGNTIDAVVRDYFTNEKITKPEGIEQVAFNNLINILKDIRTTLNSKGEHIITNKLLVSGEFSGKKIAGEMDILVITPEGKLKIYDLKTAWESAWEMYNTKTNKKLGHSLQLSLYKNMIEAETGMEVSDIAIIPITTKEDEDGNVTSVKTLEEPGFLDKASIPLEYQEVVEEYVPKTTITPAVINKTTVKPVVAEPVMETVTPAQFNEVLRLAKFFVENPKEPGTVNDAASKFPNLYQALKAIQQEEWNALEALNDRPDGTSSLPRKVLARKANEIRDTFAKQVDALRPAAPVSDIEAKKADIERRRQERKNKSLNKIITQTKTDIKTGNERITSYTALYYPENYKDSNDWSITERLEAKTEQELLDKINAKYYAESALEGDKSQVVENQADKLGYKSEDIEYGVSRTKTVKGSKLTFKDFPGTNAFVYKENGEFKFTLLSGPGNLMFYDYIPAIATSTISKEDAIQKGYDVIANEIIKKFEEEEAAKAAKAFNVENTTAKIDEITTFDEYDTAFDEINKDMANQTLENQTLVNDAFNTKKEALMNTVTIENLAQAKKRGYKIILETPENSNVKSGIFSNFTVNKSKGTVTVKSMLGTGSVTIKKADLESQIKGITTMDVKEEEPVVVTKDTADKINDVNATSSEVISSEEMQKAIADIKTQSAKDINDDFFNNLGCK